MDMSGEYRIAAPREAVWAALNDPDLLRQCIPGCEEIEKTSPTEFTAKVTAKVGPVKARFKGRMQQQDLQPPHRYTLSFEGDGGMAGFAKGSAEVELVEEGEAREQTRLNYRAQAQIGGRLAQIGSRLIDATAAKMSAQFFERLTQAITAPEVVAEAPAAPVAAAPAAARPAGVPVPLAQPAPGLVTIQMPAWTWAFTITVIALLSAWLAAH